MLMAAHYKQLGKADEVGRILRREVWTGRQHHGATEAHHSRFMRFFCQSLTDDSHGTLTFLAMERINAGFVG